MAVEPLRVAARSVARTAPSLPTATGGPRPADGTCGVLHDDWVLRVKQRSGPAPLADAQPSLQSILEDDRSRLFEGLEMV